jgi:predicted ribosomally synthesized peptide with nif11-like leader
MRSGRSWKIQ